MCNGKRVIICWEWHTHTRTHDKLCIQKRNEWSAVWGAAHWSQIARMKMWNCPANWFFVVGLIRMPTTSFDRRVDIIKVAGLENNSIYGAFCVCWCCQKCYGRIEWIKVAHAENLFPSAALFKSKQLRMDWQTQLRRKGEDGKREEHTPTYFRSSCVSAVASVRSNWTTAVHRPIQWQQKKIAWIWPIIRTRMINGNRTETV